MATLRRPLAAHITAVRLAAQPPQPLHLQEAIAPTTAAPLVAPAPTAAEVHAEATVAEAVEALAEAALEAEAEASAEAVEASAAVAAVLVAAVVADNSIAPSSLPLWGSALEREYTTNIIQITS